MQIIITASDEGIILKDGFIMKGIKALTAQYLRPACDQAQFNFMTTTELTSFPHGIRQERALELCALLSSLAQVPIKQAFAVTGSAHQHGQIQAVGGVNEKIEGFFDICKIKGLTGEQGILIPAANIKNLMFTPLASLMKACLC